MSRRDVLAVLALGLQVLGSLATLSAVALVTRRFGLEAQGQFGLLKSWMEAFVALALLGLPQALQHAAYHGQHSSGRLLSYANKHALTVAGLALVAALAAAFSSAAWLAWSLLAVPALVLHGLLRALLLKLGGPLPYAMATVMPALALLLLLALAAWFNPPSPADALGPALVLAGLLALAAVAWMLWRHGLRPQPLARLRLPLAIQLHATVQNAAAAAQAALLLGLLSLWGQSAAAIGEASLALVVLQIGAVAAAYLAPILYDRVAGRAVQTALFANLALWRPWAAWLIGGLLLTALAVLLMPWVLAKLLPGHSQDLLWACRCMVVAGVLLLCNRGAATWLQAQGVFDVLTRLAFLRLSISLLLLAALLHLGHAAAPALALAVLVAETVVAAASWPALGRGMT